jgi:hypothetical protein
MIIIFLIDFFLRTIIIYRISRQENTILLKIMKGCTRCILQMSAMVMNILVVITKITQAQLL